MTNENHVDAAVQTEWSLLTPGHHYGALQLQNRPTNWDSGSATSHVPSDSNRSRSSGEGSAISGSSLLRAASLPVPSFRPSLTDLITAALSGKPDTATNDATSRLRVVTAPEALERVTKSLHDLSFSSDKSCSSVIIHSSFETTSVPSSPESVELVGGMKSIPPKFRSFKPQSISQTSNLAPVTELAMAEQSFGK